MNIEEVREYCLSLKNTTEDMPFDEETVVYRVEGKMFLLLALDQAEPDIAVKCDPEKAVELRERYAAVAPGFHLNKKYWNDIYLQRDMPNDEIRFWISHSYAEVIRKLPRMVREKYKDVL
jgi:predicted DNA-binding protein (MmcQ/YjbR family)